MSPINDFNYFQLLIYYFKAGIGINALGILPSDVWLFSNKAATMRGKARALH